MRYGTRGRPRARWWHSCEHGAITENGNYDGATNGHDATDAEQGDDEGESGFERWRRESALGAVGTGIAKGLQNVFAPTDEHQVIVAEVPGDPPDASERVRVILDPDDPTKAVAYVPNAPESKGAGPKGVGSKEAGSKEAGRQDAGPPERGQAGADPAG